SPPPSGGNCVRQRRGPTRGTAAATPSAPGASPSTARPGTIPKAGTFPTPTAPPAPPPRSSATPHRAPTTRGNTPPPAAPLPPALGGPPPPAPQPAPAGAPAPLQPASRGRPEAPAWLRREFARLRAHVSGQLVEEE